MKQALLIPLVTVFCLSVFAQQKTDKELGVTIAHEMRHSRAFLGSGSNTEAAATVSQEAFRSWLKGLR
jgi:hypothetical protein